MRLQSVVNLKIELFNETTLKCVTLKSDAYAIIRHYNDEYTPLVNLSGWLISENSLVIVFEPR